MEGQRRQRDEIIQKLKAATLAAGDPKAIVCGNFHSRLGHSLKKCTLEQCTHVFSCGQDKRHPGQINKRRLDQDISKQEKLVLGYKDLKRRRSTIQMVEKSKTKQIGNNLLESRKSDYLNLGGNLNRNLV